jgi:hypothetical protein
MYREIAAPPLEQVRQIVLNEAFAPAATLHTTYDQVCTLVEAILDPQEACPSRREDDLEEQLAAARLAIDRLATLEGPPQRPANRVPDPATFDGIRENLEGFVAQLRIKLCSYPTRFPTPALRRSYAFNRLEGRAQAEVLPVVQNGVLQLNESDDPIRILEAGFGDPDTTAIFPTTTFTRLTPALARLAFAFSPSPNVYQPRLRLFRASARLAFARLVSQQTPPASGVRAFRIRPPLAVS